MTTKFTPGPWRVVDREVLEDGNVYPCHILGGAADYQVCTLESADIAKHGMEQPHLFPGLNGVLGPNARLIAAAPEMLEALTELVAVSPAFGPHTPLWRERESVLVRANAAIAKATGEQQ